MNDVNLTENIVKAIISDIESRKGIGDEWDQLDKGVKLQISEEWYWLVKEQIEKETGIL